MRRAYALLATIISSSIAIGSGCSSPSYEDPPILESESKKKSKKKKSTPDVDDDDQGLSSGTNRGRPPPTTPASNSETPDKGTDTDAGTGTGGAVDAGAPPPATGECASSTSADACYTCCEQAHPQGIAFLYQAFGDCACVNPGSCALECGDSYCIGGPPTLACEQCLDASTTCMAQADAACEQNAACAAMLACDRASQCASKP